MVFYGGAGNDSISAGANNDVLYGEDGADTLSSNAGNDYILGGEGDDQLYGGVGDDQFDGGAGNNLIDGGSGNDVLSIYGDINYTLTDTQFIGEGTDTLISIEGAFFIGGNGSSIFDATGFSSGKVTLYAGAGDDSLYGGADNDLIYGQEGSDIIDGGDGNDYLLGGEDNDSIIGGAGDDFLGGDGGNDTLLGRQGVDGLEGGDGSDFFGFTTPAQGIDIIYDFLTGVDKIRIDKSGFGGELLMGLLPDDQFILGMTALGVTDRFIYDQGTGALFFDRDGTGAIATIQFATLSNFSTFTASDILIV